MGSIRLTGMISGLDTDSLIKELINAQRLKNKKVSDKLTISEWKEERWKELNAKLYKLYADDLSKLRLQSSFKTKSVTASNENLVSVTSDSTVSEGVHNLSITKLASAQYLTGSAINKPGVTVNGSTKLTELDMDEGTLITIETKTGKKTIDVNSNTTINDFVQSCKDLGLNANYDVNQKRFFISSKASGAENGFTITTTNDSGIANRRGIDAAVGYSGLSSTDKAKIDGAYDIIKNNDALVSTIWDNSTISDSDDDITKLVKNAINTIKEFTEKKYKADTTVIAANKVRDDIIQAIKDKVDYEGLECKDIYDIDLEQAKNELRKQHDNEDLDFEDEAIKSELDRLVEHKISARASAFMQSDEAKNKIQTEQINISDNGATVSSTDADGNPINTIIPSYASIMTDLKTNVIVYSQSTVSVVTGQLSNIGLAEITKYTEDNEVRYKSSNEDVTLVEAADSKVTYNGAELTGSSNTIIVNGLTINLKGTTTPGETISLTVSNNTQANYDMVKNFIKSYNEILKEMNTLYYADSARGYDPLSDDEKDAMSDSQIEKWETKIKDSVLRRDTALGSVITSMKQAMMSAVNVNGKNYSLSSYGIQTSTDYTEKGLLHIYGDKDDSVYASETDKLMKAFEENPDTVIEVMSSISKKVYDTMYDKMKSIPNVRSMYTFYNDKQIDKEQTEYKKRISVLESKLSNMENKYYKQFSAMETALAKLQSQSNALASMLGTPTK